MSVDFIDTNVVAYSFDDTAPEKRDRSKQILRDSIEDHSAVISSQVIQEFLNLAIRKFEKPLSPDEALGYMQTVLLPLCAVWPSESLYQTAISLQAETGFSFYDSLIVAGAVMVDARKLLTEDLSNGQVVRGVRIENPFI